MGTHAFRSEKTVKLQFDPPLLRAARFQIEGRELVGGLLDLEIDAGKDVALLVARQPAAKVVDEVAALGDVDGGQVGFGDVDEGGVGLDLAVAVGGALGPFDEGAV